MGLRHKASAFHMLGLIIKNIINRPFRNGALILSFAFIAASLFTGQYLVIGASDSVKSGISRLGADLIVIPERSSVEGESIILLGQPSSFFFDGSVIPEIENVDGVDLVSPQIYIATLDASCCSVPIQLIAIDPNRDFTITPWLEQSLHRSLAQDEIIVGSRIIGDIGSPLEFYGHNFTIAGRLDPTGMGLDTSIFLRVEDAYIMADESPDKAVEPVYIPEGKVSAAVVKVGNASDINEVASRIQAQVLEARVMTPNYLVSKVTSQLNSALQVMNFAAIAAALISLPLIALVSLMAAYERRREIGVLRALGATRGLIFKLILAEFMLIATIGGLVGIFGSWAILYLFQDFIASLASVPVSIPSSGTLITGLFSALLLTIAIGGLASLYPSVRSALMEPYDAMRCGEL